MEPHRPDERHHAHVETSWAAFLKDLERVGNLSAAEAERAAVAVLRAFEQRMDEAHARHLEAQLPEKLRELLRAAGNGQPFHRFGRRGLLYMVARELGVEPFRVEPLVRAVFTAVRMHVSAGEADHVAAALPKDIAELWRRPGF